MTAAAIGVINEQLLRAIGVGVALLDVETLAFRFRNDVFDGWFDDAPDAASLAEALPRLDLAALRAGLAQAGRFATEQRVRRKRRTLVMALVFRTVGEGSGALIVLECQNISRMRELELMIESYAGLVERTAREHQRQRERIEAVLVDLAPRDVIDAAQVREPGLALARRLGPGAALSLSLDGLDDRMRDGDPAALSAEIDALYAAFGRIAGALGLERVRAPGDRYVCVAGAGGARGEPAAAAAAAVAGAAVRLMRYLDGRNADAGHPWLCSIGLGAGAVLRTTLGPHGRLVDAFGPALEAAETARRMAAPKEVLAAPSIIAALPGAVPLAAAGGEAARADGARAVLVDAAAWSPAPEG